MLDASFVVNVVNVNPLETLSDIASSLNNTLQESGEEFKGIASSFGSALGSVSDIFDAISKNVDLSLDALLDVSVAVDLSLDNFDFDVQVNELAAAFSATIDSDFSIEIPGTGVEKYFIGIRPSLELNLEAINTATPFSLLGSNATQSLTQFDFAGNLDAVVTVGVDGVPAEISLRAFSDDLVSPPFFKVHQLL